MAKTTKIDIKVPREGQTTPEQGVRPDRPGGIPRCQGKLFGSSTFGTSVFLDAMSELVVYQDSQMRVLWANRAAGESVGQPQERLHGRYCYEIWHRRSKPCPGCPVVLVHATGKPEQSEITTSDGRIWRVRGYPICENEDKIVGVLEVTLEITESRRAEVALRLSEARFRSLFESTHEAIGASGPDGRIVTANPAMARVLGLNDPQELIGIPAVNLYASSGDREDFIRELRTKGYVENFELTLIKQDGSREPIHILGNATLHTDEKGNIQRTDFVFSDVTGRKRVEEALRESEEKYRTITENINIGIYRNTPGPHGRFIEANPAIVKMFGYDNKEEFLNVKVSELYQDPNRRQMFNGKMQKDGFVDREELQLKRKDGFFFWGAVTAVAVFDERGQVKYYDGAIEDITEHKRAEEAVQESEEKFRMLADQSPNMIFIHSKGRIIYANKKCEEMMGYSKDEFYSPDFDFFSLIAAESREVVRSSYIKHIQGQDNQPYEYTLVTKDGQRVDAILSSKLIDYKGDKAILDTVTDISERKRAEEQRQRSLEKLQGLIEGIVHTISVTVETRDQYTAGHQRRVALLAKAIAVEMNLPSEQVKGIYMAALIHDIGKISIPAEILSKPTRLNEVEYSIIKTHPHVGYDILKGIEFPWPIADIVLTHHERMNGSGYPQGLEGQEIPLEARILSVADVVEAMASHRPYRAALGTGKALEEITQNKGKLYDPEVVKICLKIFYDRKFEWQA
jgi:PAS domain S-box-containing protein/putative nucleotidyltransferase with HDIG domain